MTSEHAAAIAAVRKGSPVEREIPLVQLYVPAEFQRPLRKTWVRRIVRSYEPIKLGMLVVSERSEQPPSYAMIDGQHRREVLAALGFETAPCIVYHDLTRAEEAELFVAINGLRKPLSPGELFHASIEAGEPEATGILAVLREFGLTAGGTPHTYGNVGAVISLREVYRVAGPAGLREVLRILTTAYPTQARKTTLAAGLLVGLDAFLARYGDVYRFEHLVNRLRATGIETVLAEASNRRHYLSRDLATLFGRVITDLYNRGLRSARLVDWDDPELARKMAGRGSRSPEHAERIKSGRDAAERVRAAEEITARRHPLSQVYPPLWCAAVGPFGGQGRVGALCALPLGHEGPHIAKPEPISQYVAGE